jgi:hypothetical protein
MRHRPDIERATRNRPAQARPSQEQGCVPSEQLVSMCLHCESGSVGQIFIVTPDAVRKKTEERVMRTTA